MKNLKTTNSLAIFDNSEQDSSDLIEITAFIRPHQAFGLEILETAEKQRLGENYDRNKLIQEALDLLIEKHIFAVRVGDKEIIKK